MEITLPVALLAGLVSFASPCFLPIVPAFVGQLVGTGVRRVSGRAALINALCFVAGFSAVFIAVWASIGLIGRSLGPYAVHARIVGGAVLVLMGLHLAGVLSIGLLDTPVRGALPSGGRDASALRAGLMGVIFGAGWTPCIGPILSGILALATMSATAWSGISLMGAYCLGLGVPIVAVALGSAGHQALRLVPTPPRGRLAAQRGPAGSRRLSHDHQPVRETGRTDPAVRALRRHG